jgi:hypothetical protein
MHSDGSQCIATSVSEFQTLLRQYWQVTLRVTQTIVTTKKLSLLFLVGLHPLKLVGCFYDL